jgi:hypothetical protein
MAGNALRSKGFGCGPEDRALILGRTSQRHEWAKPPTAREVEAGHSLDDEDQHRRCASTVDRGPPELCTAEQRIGCTALADPGRIDCGYLFGRTPGGSGHRRSDAGFEQLADVPWVKIQWPIQVAVC